MLNIIVAILNGCKFIDNPYFLFVLVFLIGCCFVGVICRLPFQATDILIKFLVDTCGILKSLYEGRASTVNELNMYDGLSPGPMLTQY
jgi:hypothetical protein